MNRIHYQLLKRITFKYQKIYKKLKIRKENIRHMCLIIKFPFILFKIRDNIRLSRLSQIRASLTTNSIVTVYIVNFIIVLHQNSNLVLKINPDVGDVILSVCELLDNECKQQILLCKYKKVRSFECDTYHSRYQILQELKIVKIEDQN